MGWVTDLHPTQQELDACVACGLCLPHCPTYRATGDETASPRGRLTAMIAVAEGEAQVDETFAEVMGFCLQCRACETACPSMVPFGRAMEGARAEIAAQLSNRRRAAQRWVTGTAVANPGLVGVASAGAAVAQRLGIGASGGGLTGKLRGIRPLPVRPASIRGTSWPAVGRPRGRVALLSGCVQDRWFGPVHAATVAVLRSAGYDVDVPGGQECCGALAAHDGAVDAARRMAAANVAAFTGYDVVVTNSAGCGAHLEGYGHWTDGGDELAGRATDVTELVAARIDDGTLPSLPTNGIRVAVQDPCHLRHAQQVMAEPRTVVRAAGYEVVDLDSSGRCCGAAGMYTVTHPEMSRELGRRKANEIEASAASIVASANPGCELQLRTYARAHVRVAHPIELYAGALLPTGELRAAAEQVDRE